jgi:hypothetical protein
LKAVAWGTSVAILSTMPRAEGGEALDVAIDVDVSRRGCRRVRVCFETAAKCRLRSAAVTCATESAGWGFPAVEDRSGRGGGIAFF